jgi:DNA helicase II / ATP-dependent DNA helicase PcrA
MSANAHASELDALLAGLNEPQREAVVHGEGPLLILAGAGSGKTRVLTHRIAYLVGTGQARPDQILAITFTNKAAQEMRERVELLVGRRTRAMWVMTFHAACARMMRADAHRLGYTRQFTIYDQADARRLVKRAIDELDVDPKRFSPAAIHHEISDAKNKLRDAEAYAQMVGSFFEQTVADVYKLYEAELHRMNAMDFDDLLVRTVNVLELFPEVRRRYAEAFRHVLVDEYQDTNHVQYRLLQLLTGGGADGRLAEYGHRNLVVVGDDSQCLVEGTLVTMGDGTRKPIEEVRAGDRVLSSHGSGDMRPARVARTHRSRKRDGVAIALRSGRQIVSTPEHTHFAGYRLGITPHLHMTYLMHRGDRGFRVGTSRTYTDGQVKPVVGVALRTRQEAADAAWVVGTHGGEAGARFQESLLSLTYGLPTLPFAARRNGRNVGLVGDQALLDELYERIDTRSAGTMLLADEGFDVAHPHFVPRSHEGRRRVLTVTLCADRRGRTPMHLVALGGRDPEARQALQRIGLNVRPAKPGSQSWRYESCFKEFGAALDVVARIREVLDVRVRCQARLGRRGEVAERATLPFIPAASVRPGMAMFTEDGGYDVVESVERITLDRPVYDLDVEGTHNFVAEGLITHNSIYGFRGADIRNILDFEDSYPDATVIKLEQNYRSTQTILDAANAVIRNNRGQREKELWTDLGIGDSLKVRELEDEHAEARYVAGEIERIVDEGVSRSEIAVFYRTNAQSRVLEDTLVRAQIGYQVIGGTKFYERAEIKDAIAYLTMLVNPQDVVSFTRIANSPRRGIGQTSLSRVISWANTAGITIWEAALDPDAVPGLGTAARKAFHRFMGAMRILGERAATNPPVAELLRETLTESGYLDALEAERTIEAQGRIENLEELVNVAAEYDLTAENTDEGPSLAGFLQQIALVADADGRRDDEGLVTLMTLHNAKGLEYPIVFLIGMEEGVFPHQRAIEEGGLEEERRLAYVGLTRAQRDLYLTYARTRAVFGQRSYGARSRFVDEVPMGLTDRSEQQAHGVGSVRARSTSWGSPNLSPLGSGGGFGDAGSGGGWASGAGGGGGGASFRLGDDVFHAAFGDGVVTGMEAGGIVVIRFSKDGSERKLVADLAPIEKR